MKNIHPDARYFETNEWVRLLDAETYLIGITDFAQTAFGDIQQVALPTAGQFIEAGRAVATVESVKALNEVTMPVAGRIIAVNEKLLEQPELLHIDPYEAGWLAKIDTVRSVEFLQLMDAEAYRNYIGDFFNK